MYKIYGFAKAELFSRHALFINLPPIVFSDVNTPEMELFVKLGAARYIIKPDNIMMGLGIPYKSGGIPFTMYVPQTVMTFYYVVTTKPVNFKN